MTLPRITSRRVSPIPEADPDLSEVVIYSSKISQLVRLTNELFGQPDTAGQLSLSVSRAIVRKADAAFISQAAPTGGAHAPSAGMVNTAGIVNAGSVAGDLDALVDAVATLQGNGPHQPISWSVLPDGPSCES